MKLRWLCCCSLLLSPSIYASSQVNHYLSAVMDESIDLPMKSVMTNEGISWIEESEVRLSTDNSKKPKHAIALRIKPKMLGQMKSESRLLNLYDTQYEQLLDKVKLPFLTERYKNLLSMMNIQDDIQLFKKERAITLKGIKLQKQLVQTNQFNASTLLKYELRSKELDGKITIYGTRLLDLKRKTGISDAVRNWILMEEIQDIIVQKMSFSGVSSVEHSELDYKIAKEELINAREKDKAWLNLVSVKYEHQVQGDNVLGLSVDVQLPSNGSRLEYAKHRANIGQALVNVQQEKRSVNQAVESIQEAIAWNKQQINQRKLSLKSIRRSLSSVEETQQLSLLLVLQKRSIDEMHVMNDLVQYSRRLYLDYLTKSQRMVQLPLRNWFIQNQPLL